VDNAVSVTGRRIIAALAVQFEVKTHTDSLFAEFLSIQERM
jgi:hypothetical protein